eukprot:jgi/Chlat1/9214/Chrsp98S08476
MAAEQRRRLTVTAYCSCQQCCSWEWALVLPGLPVYFAIHPHLAVRQPAASSKPPGFGLKKFTTTGRRYDGLTASLTRPRRPLGLMECVALLIRPWQLVRRLQEPTVGTIAADTTYYPFGTRMHVPGWGWGRVEDRGGAIRGPDIIDIYYRTHAAARQWGRRKVDVVLTLPRR